VQQRQRRRLRRHVRLPEYEEMLRESEQGSPAANELKANFQAGDFAGVVTHCRGLGVGAANDEGTWCRVLVPAALYAQLRKSDSLAAVTEACSGRTKPPRTATRARSTWP
jgi:hypothetical protein